MKQCETCAYLDAEETPCACKKGRGKVAYARPACPDYREKRRRNRDRKTTGTTAGR
jgi:hypothetical protein